MFFSSNYLISSLFNYYLIDYFYYRSRSVTVITIIFRPGAPIADQPLWTAIISNFTSSDFWIQLTKQIRNSLTILFFLFSMHLFKHFGYNLVHPEQSLNIWLALLCLIKQRNPQNLLIRIVRSHYMHWILIMKAGPNKWSRSEILMLSNLI